MSYAKKCSTGKVSGNGAFVPGNAMVVPENEPEVPEFQPIVPETKESARKFVNSVR